MSTLSARTYYLQVVVGGVGRGGYTESRCTLNRCTVRKLLSDSAVLTSAGSIFQYRAKAEKRDETLMMDLCLLLSDGIILNPIQATTGSQSRS